MQEKRDPALDDTDPVVVVLDNFLLASSSSVSSSPPYPVPLMNPSSISSLSPNQWFQTCVHPYLLALQILAVSPRRYQVLEIAEEIVETLHAAGIRFCWRDVPTFVSHPTVVHVLTKQWMGQLHLHVGEVVIVKDVKSTRTFRRLEAQRRAATPTQSSSSRDDTSRVLSHENEGTAYGLFQSHSQLSAVGNDLSTPQTVWGLGNVSASIGAEMKAVSHKTTWKKEIEKSTFMSNDNIVDEAMKVVFMEDEPNVDTPSHRPSEPYDKNNVVLKDVSKTSVDSQDIKPSSERPKRVYGETPMEERVYVEVMDQDVCGGRGVIMHPGNRQFHEWKLELMQTYLSVPPRSRAPMIQELLNRVHRSGGRFLQHDENGWYEAHPVVARAKCYEVFRDQRVGTRRRIAQQGKP
eukprot:scaffold1400_cov175-Amphora_coffeaeformis.AAC.18